MTQSMGKIIKSLRKERGYTQEELAEMVGVSFQAVSKWENDLGMPDVSQIVPLARVFGVPTDVLFAYECDEQESVDKIISDVEESDNLLYDEYPKLLNALKLYPNNEVLLEYTLKTGKRIRDSLFSHKDEKLESHCESLIRVAKKALEISENTNIYARTVLIYAYCDVKDFAAARRETEKLHGYHDTCGKYEQYILAAEGNTEGSIDMLRKNVAAALNDIGNSVRSLTIRYKKLGRIEDAISVHLKYIDILLAAGEDGEFEYPLDTLPTTCLGIAMLYASIEKYDDAIDWLEKMFDYAEKRYEYFSHEDNKSKSLILGVPPYYDTREICLKYDACHYERMTLARPEFTTPMREMPRFKELLDKYAK